MTTALLEYFRLKLYGVEHTSDNQKTTSGKVSEPRLKEMSPVPLLCIMVLNK